MDDKENKSKDAAESAEGNPESTSGGPSEDDSEVNLMQRLLQRFGISVAKDEEEEKPEQLLEEITFEGIAKYIKSEKCKNIIVMTGAGVSTSAGIPDFRSPGTGLYDNLSKYNLPKPESVFDISYFKVNPEPFFKLAKELYPGTFKPTLSHYFVKLLEEKNLLLRIYTQNIDTLERIAGISSDKIVEAHGTFHSAHCMDCKTLYSQQFVKEEIFKDKIPKCTDCDGVVKPDIVFFGESLPWQFGDLVPKDMPECDLLIVMGTSLVVQPFASLTGRVPDTTPRLLINRDKAGMRDDFMSLFYGGDGFRFDKENNYRDVAWLGNADDGCLALADLLGWKEELLAMLREGHITIDEESETETTAKASGHDGNTVTNIEHDTAKNRQEDSETTKGNDGEETAGSSGEVSGDETIYCLNTKNHGEKKGHSMLELIGSNAL